MLCILSPDKAERESLPMFEFMDPDIQVRQYVPNSLS